MADIIEVTTRVNYGLLQKMVQEEVRLVLKTMLKAPIGQLAGDPVEEVTAAPRPRKPAKTKVTAKFTPASPAPKPAHGPGLKAADPVKELVSVLEAAPEGIRGADLRAKLGWAKGYYSYQLKKPDTRKLFLTKGQKTGATYFPNTKAIEKYKANGQSEASAAPN